MGLPWVRLDTQFATNPKVLYLVEDRKFRALHGYICGLGYSGVHGTAGFIPAAALPFLHMTRRDADDLVAVGLWVSRPGGYEINDYAAFQGLDAEAQERSAKARAAANIRWHGAPSGAE